jgi:hypothetical protein
VRIGFIWLRIEPAVSSCEHSNEPLDFIKGREFFTNLVTFCFSRRILLRGVSLYRHDEATNLRQY